VPSKSISGREEWLLFFWGHRKRPLDSPVQMVYVRNLQPGDLLAVRILDDATTAFRLEVLYDTACRPCSAGDMLQAMYGIDPQRGLRIPAIDFVRPLRGGAIRVVLRVHADVVSRINAIAVAVVAEPVLY